MNTTNRPRPPVFTSIVDGGWGEVTPLVQSAAVTQSAALAACGALVAASAKKSGRGAAEYRRQATALAGVLDLLKIDAVRGDGWTVTRMADRFVQQGDELVCIARGTVRLTFSARPRAAKRAPVLSAAPASRRAAVASTQVVVWN